FVLKVKNYEGKIENEQRPRERLLANMCQVPMIKKEYKEIYQIKETNDKIDAARYTNVNKVGELRHVFSHIIWELDVYEAEINKNVQSDFYFVAMESLTS